MSNFKKKLAVVWDRAGKNENHRYIPRATGLPNGNWRVFDMKENRFLSDRELRAIPIDVLTAERHRELM